MRECNSKRTPVFYKISFSIALHVETNGENCQIKLFEAKDLFFILVFYLIHSLGGYGQITYGNDVPRKIQVTQVQKRSLFDL